MMWIEANAQALQYSGEHSAVGNFCAGFCR